MSFRIKNCTGRSNTLMIVIWKSASFFMCCGYTYNPLERIETEAIYVMILNKLFIASLKLKMTILT